MNTKRKFGILDLVNIVNVIVILAVIVLTFSPKIHLHR